MELISGFISNQYEITPLARYLVHGASFEINQTAHDFFKTQNDFYFFIYNDQAYVLHIVF